MGLAALSAGSRGGPISPPAGPVAGTGRTLLEVEPRIPVGPVTTPGDSSSVYRISQPGSYYLTGNLIGVADKHGIVIDADDVTVDLNGFEVLGPAGGGGAGDFTGVQSSRVSSRVLNGAVSRWPFSGVTLGGGNGLVSGVLARNCGFTGITVYPNGVITDCNAVACRFGIGTGGGATVLRTTAASCTERGFYLGAGSAAHQCNASGCTVAGFFGNGAVMYYSCTAYSNTGVGFKGDFTAGFIQCQSYFNVGLGFDTGTEAVLDGCISRTHQHAGVGGFKVGDRSSLTRCVAQGNSGHGIEGSSRVVVRSCIADGNSSFGIHITGTDCRIEDNHATGNSRGISVTGSGNLIVRNSVAGNGVFGYAIAAGNMFGPNVFNQAGLSANTNPQSNYEY